ncbi:arsenate reductase/protein-tyrosine-phosphatase family protein [Tenggerimyces flavus]|uniref:MarR family transcriptional regulator n=1 Tax=Tenggerimyces flavus TaxID=1708749 RepID=A0ABV7YC61_9ACTN|nr:MarR family transcriptional regulator [Tenggerimyces flavus]MBM7789755.1 protein-tyrosine-phosphatase/DNA-binding HxlR family transcriptional regulator [Tenggerimyces flavus]
MNTERSLERRARVHAALGDPARLAIVDALSVGDASPGELGRELSLSTNLVAHHVNVLQDAGLIDRTRSEGDRRRTYLRLRPDALAELRLPGLPVGARVVFVCTHNSARSPLAAALWTHRTRRPAASAGTDPAHRVHPRAVRVARRHGLELDPTGTAHATDVVRENDLVIAVCDTAHEHLAAGPTHLRPHLHWSVPDPARIDTAAAFEATYADLEARIGRLGSALDSPPPEGARS